jgi:hypothetical protein
MEEKGKKILGFVLGFIAPGFLLPVFLPFIVGIGLSGIISLLLILVVAFFFRKIFSIKFFFIGLVISLLSIAVPVLIILGSCIEHPFMGSSSPGAGTPFFITAAVIAIFAIGLFIISVISLVKTPKEEVSIPSNV